MSDELNSCVNRQSLIELYGVLRPSLHAYVCSLGLRQDRAEDVIQETFLRLVRHTMRFGTHENLRAWAFRVARNISVDFHRGEKRWFRGGEPDPILGTRIDPAPSTIGVPAITAHPGRWPGQWTSFAVTFLRTSGLTIRVERA